MAVCVICIQVSWFFLQSYGQMAFSWGFKDCDVVLVKSEYSVHMEADLKPEEDRAVYRANLQFPSYHFNLQGQRRSSGISCQS